MSFFRDLFGTGASQNDLRGLYAAVIGRAREAHWYRDGAVPDTLDGRFDMLVAILSLVMLRMEALGAQADSARLAEIFVDDMDGQLRQSGIGDLVVGKHIGRMMSALGGRLGAYRAALAGEEDFAATLERNLWRGDAPGADAVAHVADRLREIAIDLEGMTLRDLRAARIGAAA